MQTRTVKVSNLSVKATERDVHDFFSFSGEIEHIELRSEGDESNAAFVTFKDPEALDTAILLSGATIVDKIVSITDVEDFHPSSGSDKTPESMQAAGTGSAFNKAQDVMTTMLAKGYDLGKDAMNRAKGLDEKHQFSANATATVTSIDKKIGLTQKISSGTAVVNEQVKALDQKYQVSEKTRSALVAAEQKMSSAGSALLKNKYVFTSASWVTGAFSRVTKGAGEGSQKTFEKAQGSEVKGTPGSEIKGTPGSDEDKQVT